ncbi:glycosyltransferase family 39 protein [Streptomyces filamentosus]|nr:glycosyltransferase family 39 protein [Streptomyces filamentosus]
MILRILGTRPNPPLWTLPAAWTVAFGLWGLSRQDSVWRDEAATWQVALRPAGAIGHMLENVDVVHGLYYLLMHGLFSSFGPGTTTLRLPSVLATAVAAACVTELGRRLAGARAGLAAGTVLGLLPAVQFHLQEGRPYALVAAGAAVSTLLLVRALEGHDRTRSWAAYGCTVLVCALLNWLSLLLLPAHLATLLRTRAGRGLRRRWAVASGAAVAGALPLVLFSAGQAGQVDWIPPLTWPALVGPAVLLAIGGLGARLAGPGRGRLSAAAVGFPLLALPQAALAGISLVRPLFLDRYVLFSLLGLALLIGAGLAVAARTAPWVLPVTLAVTAAALLPQAQAKRSPDSRVDDVLAAAEEVGRLKEPGDGVLFVPAARRDTALVSPDAFRGLRDLALAEGPRESGTLKGVETGPAAIRAAMRDQRRILLVTDAGTPPDPLPSARDRTKAAVLAEDFAVVADVRVRGRRVTVYERRAAPGGASRNRTGAWGRAFRIRPDPEGTA